METKERCCEAWGHTATGDEKEEEQIPRGKGSGSVRERPKGTEIPG